MSTPYVCPVCVGRCTVPGGFYSFVTDSLTAIPLRETCRSCTGTGIVWRGDDDTEGQPAIIPPNTPISFGGGVVTFNEPLATYSFTALQGVIPASNPASSVEPPAITKEREERQSSIDPARRAVGGIR